MNEDKAKELVEGMLYRGYFLGGSRRMHQKYPDKIVLNSATDWDLYKEFSKLERKFLVEKGFVHKHIKTTYKDDLAVEIWEHSWLPIQVVLRKRCDIYNEAFESLSAEVFLNKLWKSSPKKSIYQDDVRRYFNGLFKLHGYKKKDTLNASRPSTIIKNSTTISHPVFGVFLNGQ